MSVPQPPKVDKPAPASHDLAVLACVLLVAAGLITRGVWILSEAAGWITGGVLLAAVAALFLLEDGK